MRVSVANGLVAWAGAWANASLVDSGTKPKRETAEVDGLSHTDRVTLPGLRR
jgi:hypothetical protein